MTRRIMLALFGALTEPSVSSEPTVQQGNAFAMEYLKWANLRNVRGQGVLPAPEMLQWQRVKSAWHSFCKAQDAEYRGYR